MNYAKIVFSFLYPEDKTIMKLPRPYYHLNQYFPAETVQEHFAHDEVAIY